MFNGQPEVLLLPRQNDMALAGSVILVQGELFTQMPEDLYIPPDALEVFLDAFQGPLDLLLYLIKRQNLDILDIPITPITKQYMEYVELMKDFHLELAAEYLVMAAMLAEIKSRLLLPKSVDEEGEEEDPRAELVRRLQEYERFKQAAEELNELPRRRRDTFAANAEPPELPKEEQPIPNLELQELMSAFRDVLKRISLNTAHQVMREQLSVRERMSNILNRLQSLPVGKFVPFHECFDIKEGKQGVVVTFIAVLELLRNTMIKIVQSEPFAPIHVMAYGDAAVPNQKIELSDEW